MILLHHERAVIGGFDGPFSWIILSGVNLRLDGCPVARANGPL